MSKHNIKQKHKQLIKLNYITSHTFFLHAFSWPRKSRFVGNIITSGSISECALAVGSMEP